MDFLYFLLNILIIIFQHDAAERFLFNYTLIFIFIHFQTIVVSQQLELNDF